MKVIKNYEIEGFNTSLLKKGQVIKVKKHLSKREREYEFNRGRKFEFLYFIKDVDIKKLTLIDYTGKEHTLTLSELKPDLDFDDTYYEIIKIYETDSGVTFF